jgi:sugar phosphate isomerase/epimerase
VTRTLSCCAWALERAEPAMLAELAGMGLTAVDVRPSMLRAPEACEARERLGLDVRCVAASHEMPDHAAFDSTDAAAVEAACAHVRDAISHAGAIGAEAAYVVPEAPVDGGSLERFAGLLPPLADHAAEAGVRLCIEHFPGTALPTAAATLGFLRAVGHANLYLLFDIGHAQMSGEDPRATLTAAADRLGYVHLDDNDGVDDLHLALTDGVQSRASLVALQQVLNDVGYAGPVSLEMKSDLPDPADAIRRSLATWQEITQ